MLVDLQIVVDKSKVMDAIQCYKNNPGYEETSVLYDALLPEFKLLVKPAAGYIFLDNNAEFAVPAASHCDKLVYCALTLGQAVCDKISAFFAAGNYQHGILLNAMADELLAYYEQTLYMEIKKAADLDGYGLTKKLVPREGCFEQAFQQQILVWFNSVSDRKIGLLPDYTVLPVKSEAYLYGADALELTAEIEHDCMHCDNSDCHMRKKEEEQQPNSTYREQNNNWPDKVRVFFDV